MQKSSDVDKFFALAEKYAGFSDLTAPLLNEMIDKIVVHKPEKIDGHKHVTIEVLFNYVGEINIPAQRSFVDEPITV